MISIEVLGINLLGKCIKFKIVISEIPIINNVIKILMKFPKIKGNSCDYKGKN